MSFIKKLDFSLIYKKIKDNKHIIIAFFTAVVAIGICSKSSPIYPFNDWYDSNCFLTVGKSMLHGFVPYRDIFEQKGPVLYMLHALAALISDKSFVGVYFIEVLFAAFFLVICYKILSLYSKNPSYLWMPVIAGIIYSADGLCHGDSAEEFCLPLIAYCLYFGLKAVKNNALPDNEESFFIGVTSAFVLWIKYTMLGFYIGWFVAFIFIALSQKKIIPLLKMTGLIAAGVAAASLPILIYFAVSGALDDLWTVYFYDNLFLYSQVEDQATGASRILNNLKGGESSLKHYNLFTYLLIFVALIDTFKRRFSEFVLFSLSAAGLFVITYIGGRGYPYYSFIFSALAVMGLVELSVYEEKLREKLKDKIYFKTLAKVVVPAVCAIYSFYNCDNTYLLEYEKSDLPQYQFAEIINQKEDATLLNYGFLDGGFYTVADVLPSTKYFCKLNLPLDDIMDAQNEIVANGLVDFVVTNGITIHQDNYEEVGNMTFYYEGFNINYHLYQLKEITE